MKEKATRTLYTRVSGEDKEFLTELARKDEKWSENYIINQLIKYVRGLSSEEINEILTEQATGAVGTASRLMEQQAWADHAFNQKRWGWATEEYKRLAQESPQAQGSWRLAQYKLGFCWIEEAIALRRAAILSDSILDSWNDYYEAAGWALRASIAYGEKYSDHRKQKLGGKEGRHAVVLFNIACAWGLRAQYCVEHNLGPQSQIMSNILKSFQNGIEAPRISPTETNLFQGWRKEFSSKRSTQKATVERQVDLFAEKAFDALRLMGECAFPLDKTFLVRLAQKDDSDLIFLRTDEKWSEKFTFLIQSLDNAGSMLEEFQRLQELVTKDISKRVKELL